MVAYHAYVHTSALGTIRAPKKKASRYTVRLGTQGCTLYDAGDYFGRGGDWFGGASFAVL
jgi:hypothetical protein